MTDMDHALKGVTVERFIDTLRDAVANLGVVQPAELRAPLALWLRVVEARAIGEGWTHLLGRPVVSAWNAARAVVHGGGSDQEDDVDQLGQYIGYLGDMFALVDWLSPWTWLVVVALVMAFKAANN